MTIICESLCWMCEAAFGDESHAVRVCAHLGGALGMLQVWLLNNLISTSSVLLCCELWIAASRTSSLSRTLVLRVAMNL